MTVLDEVIEGESGPLLGAAVHTYNPAFLEIAAYLGYHAAWIEMEHSHISFAQAADLCRIASGLGLITLIRIPDSRRENVLKAAECGPDIIDLPMTNSTETAEEFVRHARYGPLGRRGFFGSSRAVRYGVHPSIVEEQQRINRELCLMVQIETQEAVENADAICAVEGIDAVLLGPGDLSSSLGVTGQTGHPVVDDGLHKAIAAAKGHGKRVAMACAPSDVEKWSAAGVELLFFTGDVSCMRAGARAALDQISHR